MKNLFLIWVYDDLNISELLPENDFLIICDDLVLVYTDFNHIDLKKELKLCSIKFTDIVSDGMVRGSLMLLHPELLNVFLYGDSGIDGERPLVIFSTDYDRSLSESEHVSIDSLIQDLEDLHGFCGNYVSGTPRAVVWRVEVCDLSSIVDCFVGSSDFMGRVFGADSDINVLFIDFKSGWHFKNSYIIDWMFTKLSS